MSLVDPERMRQIFRVYRAARTTREAVRGYKRAKRMLDDHREQSEVLMDAEDLTRRIQNDQVRPEDIHNAAKFAFNSIPKVYGAVSKYIAKRNAEKAAELADEET